VSAIALLCLVLLCTPVQLDCSLVALQADLLFTPVDACSVRLLFIVLRLCRPTLRIHSWSLQHEKVTYLAGHFRFRYELQEEIIPIPGIA
jgi:hypothetical protein